MDSDLKTLGNALPKQPNQHPPRRQRIVFPDTSSSDDDDDDQKKEQKKKKECVPIVMAVAPDYNFSTNEEDHVDPILFAGDRDESAWEDDRVGHALSNTNIIVNRGEGVQDVVRVQQQQQQQQQLPPRQAPQRRARYGPPPTTAELEQQQRKDQEDEREKQERHKELLAEMEDGRGSGDQAQQDADDDQNEEVPTHSFHHKHVLNKDGYAFNLDPEAFYQDPVSNRDEIFIERRQRHKDSGAAENVHIVNPRRRAMLGQVGSDGEEAGDTNDHDDDDDDDDDDDEADSENPFSSAALMEAVKTALEKQAANPQLQQGAAKPLPKFPAPPAGVFGIGSGLPGGVSDMVADLSSAAKKEEEEAVAAPQQRQQEHGGGGDDDDVEFEGEEDEEALEGELDEMLLVEAVRRMVAVCLEQLEDVAEDHVAQQEGNDDEDDKGDNADNKEDKKREEGEKEEENAVIALNEEAASGKAHRASFQKFVAVCQPLLSALEEDKMSLDDFIEESAQPMLEIHRVLRRWSRPPKPPNIVVDGKVCDM